MRKFRRPSTRSRKWQIAAVAGAAVTLAGVGLGVASASENNTSAGQTISCPGVAGALPAIPAQSADEVQRNLALLNTQLAEANKRLATSAGQGGPNFVQNAILGPLKDKRVSTIDRIAISIGRHAAKPQLDEQKLATCTLGGSASAAEPTAVTTAPAGGNAQQGGGNQAGSPTVNCPAVTGLPSIPAQAADEVQRNLALLNTQIAEADKRLITSAGEGGPNFIQNAILGPLKDKRVSTINRIETAIGRHAAKPDLHVATVAPCTLNR